MTHSAVTHVINLIRSSIKTHNLLPPHHNLLLALSGGQDSLALCESLRHIRDTTHPTPWPLFALAHCDHRWPGDEGIAAHVRRYADSVHLPLLLFDAEDNPPPCSESAGREWRYAALTRMAKERRFHTVLTGHTRTDLAETVLFNLCHGAGSDGLSAMGWKRQLCDEVALVRPMLDVSRHDTGAFCEQRGLHVRHDVYNQDRRYARNRIRGDIMPVLKEGLHGKVEEGLARTASLLREEARHLEDEAGRVFERAVVVEGDGRLLMDRDMLAASSVAVRRRVVKRVLEEHLNLDARRKVFKQVEAVVRLCEGRVGEASPSLAKGGGARVLCERWIEINR